MPYGNTVFRRSRYRVTATCQRHLVTLVTTSYFQSSGRERGIQACNAKSFRNTDNEVLETDFIISRKANNLVGKLQLVEARS